MVEYRLLNPLDMMCFSQLMSFRGNMTGELLLELIIEESEEGVSDDEIIRRYNEARKAGDDQRRTVWA